MNLVSKLKIAIAGLSFASVLVLMPATLSAQGAASPSVGGGDASIGSNLRSGACLNVSGECTVDDAETSVNTIITTVINIFSLVVGVVSVIMIIVGGLKYITSGGESGNVTGAKNTILYAIVGLVIVALAQVIVKFVLNRISVTEG